MAATSRCKLLLYFFLWLFCSHTLFAQNLNLDPNWKARNLAEDQIIPLLYRIEASSNLKDYPPNQLAAEMNILEEKIKSWNRNVTAGSNMTWDRSQPKFAKDISSLKKLIAQKMDTQRQVKPTVAKGEVLEACKSKAATNAQTDIAISKEGETIPGLDNNNGRVDMTYYFNNLCKPTTFLAYVNYSDKNHTYNAKMPFTLSLDLCDHLAEITPKINMLENHDDYNFTALCSQQGGHFSGGCACNPGGRFINPYTQNCGGGHNSTPLNTTRDQVEAFFKRYNSNLARYGNDSAKEVSAICARAYSEIGNSASSSAPAPVLKTLTR